MVWSVVDSPEHNAVSSAVANASGNGFTVTVTSLRVVSFPSFTVQVKTVSPSKGTVVASELA